MADNASPNPIERRVLRLVHDGVDDTEIARRFRRSPDFVRRVITYANMPRARRTRDERELRPLERRILKWRASGAGHADIARRFHRSAGHIERVERLVSYRRSAG
jgi:hypothetical protein